MVTVPSIDFTTMVEVPLPPETSTASAPVMVSPSAEATTVEKLHEFIEKSGYKIRDKHHEIYISDVRRTKPERLKTVIRQPIEQK